MTEYVPAKVWTWDAESGGTFASINRPIAGATHEKPLPVGKHPLQLYSLATPNGQKVTILLEELLALGHSGAEYDAWLIKIGDGDQFGSGFVAVNPNSKIPALMDHSGATPIRVFESGAILQYLAEKFGAFLPTEPAARAECLSWLFWQMGSAPYLGAASGISMPMRRARWNTRSTASPWRPSANWMCWISAWRSANTSPGMNTPLPTSRYGLGTVGWSKAACMATRRSFSLCMNTSTCCAGPTQLTPGRRCSAGGG